MRCLSLRWLLHAIQRLILNSNSFRNLQFLWSKLCARLSRALARNITCIVSKSAHRDPRVDGDGEMKWGQNHSHTIPQLERQGSQSPSQQIISTPASEKHCLSLVPSSICALNLPQDCGGQSQNIEMGGYVVQDHPLRQPCPTAQPNGEADLTQERSSFPVRDIAVDSTREMSKHAVSFSHHRIRPLVPETVARYDRNIFIPREHTEYKIPSLTTSFSSHDSPAGWSPCLHPEGALYFYHEQKRVFTDANLYEDHLLLQINSDLDTIDDFFRASNIQRSPGVDIVLELIPQEGGMIDTYYYLADHKKRCIFFLEEFDASNLPVWQEVKGVTCLSHIGHEIQVQYWYHCLLFPRSLDLSHEMVNELRDMITHSMGDLILSATSNTSYSVEDLQKMLSLVDSVKENVGTAYKGSTCVLSALMYVFVRERFYHFHGQPCARLGRDQSIYGEVRGRRSWLIHSLSPVLLYAPEYHLRTLEKMWIDGLTRETLWRQFTDRLNTEWQEMILYATVLLNANVAFLAIQSVDVVETPARSPAQISSYMSVIASVGAILVGLLLARQNRMKARETAADASVFLHRTGRLRLGLESLAIIFSLPYALLIWGMVCFLAAFLFMCFKDSDLFTRLLVGAALGAMIILSVWCIQVWVAWKRIKQVELEPEPDALQGAKESCDQIPNSPKYSWSWQSLLFRRSSCDSEETVV